MDFLQPEDLTCDSTEPVRIPLIEVTTICEICGEKHATNKCSVINVKHHMKDTPVLSKARLSLPESLELQTMAAGEHSITAKTMIEAGTKFGPFEAKRVFTPDLDIKFPLKIFHLELFQQLYLNNSTEEECNWMFFVQPAESIHDQNLVCYEEESKIFFTSIRDIIAGEHLRVWYAPYYAKKMGKDVFVTEDVLEEETEILDLDQLVRQQQNVANEKTWKCKFCNEENENVAEFANHMLHHYQMQKYRTCEFCSFKFRSIQILQKHITIVHFNKYDKQTNNSEKDLEEDGANLNLEEGLGGPLLNNKYLNMENTLLDDNMNENSNLENTSMNLDNDFNLNINENYNFNFNLLEGVNDNDSYKCDICSKSFIKIKSLIQHLTMHTGKYTCNKCKKVFARKESLENHVSCEPNRVTLFKCYECGKCFMVKKNLLCHIRNIHKVKEFICNLGCSRKFTTKESALRHKCLINCNSCNKTFPTPRKLSIHMRIHSKEKDELQYLCDICSEKFISQKQFDQHKLSHREEKFACDKCDKTFQWKSSCDSHQKTHQNEKFYSCETCNKQFSQQKYLLTHMLVHKEQYDFHCEKCPKRFKMKSNLYTHIKRHHLKKCLQCNLLFDNVKTFNEHYKTHFKNSFKCPICKHVVKLKTSLFRHIRIKHSDLNINCKELDNKAIENVNNNDNQYENVDTQINSDKSDSNSEDIDKLLRLKDSEISVDDIYTNLDDIVTSYVKNSEAPVYSPVQTIVNNDKNIDHILDFDCLSLDFGNCNNQGSSLSMPVVFDSN